MKTEKGDFLEIEYIGRIKDTNLIFDLTDEKIAKENGIYNPDIKYGPIVICIGEKNVLKGLDKSLEGKEIGQSYSIIIDPEDGFGKKDPKLVRLVRANIFKENNIMPVPGLRINLGGITGTIRTIASGRVSVDFNHPLSGKTLIYEIKLIKKIENPKEKVKACVEFTGLKEDSFKIEEKPDNIFEIEINQEMNEPIKKAFESKIKGLVPEAKKVNIKISVKG